MKAVTETTKAKNAYGFMLFLSVFGYLIDVVEDDVSENEYKHSYEK
jgi:hypothetical protein